jgi:exonuclease SbcC
MRLESLTIDGFRGFATEASFDLSADTIIVVGANGNGKTCLFDGILWALAGRVPRLGSDNAALLSRFSGSGSMRVVLTLADGTMNRTVRITRSFDGSNMRVLFETSDSQSTGLQAESDIADLIWPHAATSSSPGAAVATAITRCVYLQQDLVRQFIESDDNKQRFAVVSELVGAGRVTDLLRDLETAKANWTRRTTGLRKELAPVREQLSLMKRRAAEIMQRGAAPTLDELRKLWTDWWLAARRLGSTVEPPELSSRSAAVAVGSALKQLDAIGSSRGRRWQQGQSLLKDLRELISTAKPDLTFHRDTVHTLQEEAANLQQQVSEERGRAAEGRRAQAALEEKEAQLRALAQLALKHLDDRCPVCRQLYDRAATHQYLAELSAPIASPSNGRDDTSDERLNALLLALADKEKQLVTAQMAQRSAEAAVRAYEETLAAINRRLHEVGVELESISESVKAVEAVAAEDAEVLNRVQDARRRGEELALRVSQLGDEATLDELQREIQSLEQGLAKEDGEFERRDNTGAAAQNVIDALRDAGNAIVERRLGEIEPLLQGIYARIDPHPAFSAIAFLTAVERGRGLLDAQVTDPVSDVSDREPQKLLSSSQMNALAVSIFLALNLGVPRLPIATAILDDPIQSLDDINLLGLMDLLRRTKDTRQLCLSTHDDRFARLLERKLRPIDGNQRTTLIKLHGWSRRGPEVSIREVQPDPAPLRLVAS